MTRGCADILMYHSISDRGGPTSTTPEVFAAQMSALAASGLPVVDLDVILNGTLPDRAVILTFDDAFDDFASTAWPVLEKHGHPATVYVPTGYVGRAEDWMGVLAPQRSLMDWPTIRKLADEGVSFGSHSVSHPDLTTLDRKALAEQLAESKATLEEELGRAVVHFAPPYGRSNPAVRQAIERNYATSVGTRLGQAGLASDRFDLPRLEMAYYRSPRDWHRHLEGRGGGYLTVRRGLRAVRNVVSHPARRA